MIDRLVGAGAPVDRCCVILGVTRQNYYKQKRKPTTATQLCRQWLTGLIREIHVASRGTYGYRRVHAELTLGMGITVCPRTVSVLMTWPASTGCPDRYGSSDYVAWPPPTIWSIASSTDWLQMSCGSMT